MGTSDSSFGFIDHFPLPQNLGRELRFDFFQLNNVQGKSSQLHGVAEKGEPGFRVQDSFGGDVDIRMVVEMLGTQQGPPLDDPPGPVFFDDHPNNPVEVLRRQMEAFHSRPVSGGAAFFEVFFDFLDVQWKTLSIRPRKARREKQRRDAEIFPNHPKRPSMWCQMMGTALFWGVLFDSLNLQKPEAGEAGSDGAGLTAEGGGELVDTGTAEKLGSQLFFFVCRPWLVGAGVGLADLFYVGGFGLEAQGNQSFLKGLGNLWEVLVQDHDPALGAVCFVFPAFLEIEVAASFFGFLDFKVVGLDPGGNRL